MCDYSLEAVSGSRMARQGEKVVTHDFKTRTNGFRGLYDPGEGFNAVAVCMLPGTELSFGAPIEATTLGNYVVDLNGEKKVIGMPPEGANQATLVQVDKDQAQRHHDALLFADGTLVLLTQLKPGQTAEVLKLPVSPRTTLEAHRQRRAVYA